MVVPNTRQFNAKKWTLFVFTCIAIVSTLIIVTTACLAINALDDDDIDYYPRSNLRNSPHNISSSYNLASEGNLTESAPVIMKFVTRYTNSTSGGGDSIHDSAKKTARAIIISVGVASIVVQFLGMVGALKEQFCMLVTYSILCTIIAAANIASSLEGSSGSWFSVVLYILISCLAYSFARDVRFMRTAHLQTTIVTTNPNVVYGVNGMAYPVNVPVQHWQHVPALGGFGAMPVPYGAGPMPSNSIYGNTGFAMQPGQTYANAPPNPYQPFPNQPWPVKESETSFSYNTGGDERRVSSGAPPPPYPAQNENI